MTCSWLVMAFYMTNLFHSRMLSCYLHPYVLPSSYSPKEGDDEVFLKEKENNPPPPRPPPPSLKSSGTNTRHQGGMKRSLSPPPRPSGPLKGLFTADGREVGKCSTLPRPKSKQPQVPMRRKNSGPKSTSGQIVRSKPPGRPVSMPPLPLVDEQSLSEGTKRNALGLQHGDIQL